MSGDHHGGGRRLRRLTHEGDALVPQGPQDGGVVHEITEDRERRGLRLIDRQRDGVADAKAHPEMLCPDDSHGWPAELCYRRVLYNIKYLPSLCKGRSARDLVAHVRDSGPGTGGSGESGDSGLGPALE